MPRTSSTTDSATYDPIIVDSEPPDVDKIWKDCSEASNHVMREDGTVNYRAAACADPGVTTCPACGRYHWNIGRWHKCTNCEFVYPTDAWPMFSWGVVEARRRKSRQPPCPGLDRLAEKRMAHPYYKFGFDHADTVHGDDLHMFFLTIDWRKAMSGIPQPTHLKGLYV
jgi:hypothetical protein